MNKVIQLGGSAAFIPTFENAAYGDKAVRVLLLGGCAPYGSLAGSGGFASSWVRSYSAGHVGFFTTVKLD